MQLKSINDQELIMLYLDGNDRAFEELLTRHKNKIYTTIYLFVKDEHQAEDIFQEVFIKIIDTLRKGKYNHEGKFVQWAVRIAYNLCVDHFRRSKRRSIVNTTENFDIFDVLAVAEDSHEDVIIKSQSHEKLRAMIDSLPSEQREVIILRHYADMSFKEISLVTKVSINTALGRMRYALINIRRNLKEKEVMAI